MGPKFAVREDSVVKHSSNLETSEQALNTNAQSFISAIADLPAVWQGSAFSSWEALTEAWNAAMKDLNLSLALIKSNVSQAGSLYHQYEAQQTEQLNSTMSSAAWDSTRFNMA